MARRTRIVWYWYTPKFLISIAITGALCIINFTMVIALIIDPSITPHLGIGIFGFSFYSVLCGKWARLEYAELWRECTEVIDERTDTDT
jgi:hypothetical protein